jgi:hypothetical protein
MQLGQRFFNRLFNVLPVCCQQGNPTQPDVTQ